jgi:hypothetical protein
MADIYDRYRKDLKFSRLVDQLFNQVWMGHMPYDDLMQVFDLAKIKLDNSGINFDEERYIIHKPSELLERLKDIADKGGET